MTLKPVATRSAISVDLSGTYWLTFISSLWKVRLMLAIYRTAKMEWLCQPWLEGQGLTLSPLQGCTQKAWQETTTAACTSGNNALNKCTWSSHGEEFTADRLLNLHLFKTWHPYLARSNFQGQITFLHSLFHASMPPCPLFHMISHVWWHCHKPISLTSPTPHTHTH